MSTTDRIFSILLDEAEAETARSLAIAELLSAKGMQVLVGRTTMLCLIRRQRWNAAQTAGEAALALAKSCGASGQALVLHGLLGEVGLALGDGTAVAHFRDMHDVANRLNHASARALALFGLAAAEPYHPSASARAEEARATIEQVASGLAGDAHRAYVSTVERHRVLAGNFVNFSLPLERRRSAPSGPLGLGW